MNSEREALGHANREATNRRLHQAGGNNLSHGETLAFSRYGDPYKGRALDWIPKSEHGKVNNRERSTQTKYPDFKEQKLPRDNRESQ